MPTLSFEGETHQDLVRQVREWLASAEAEEPPQLADLVVQGGELTKDALRVIASAAPKPIGESDIVRSLTDMGHRATDEWTSAVVRGLEGLEEMTGGSIVKRVADAGSRAVWQMNTVVARQVLDAFGSRGRSPDPEPD